MEEETRTFLTPPTRWASDRGPFAAAVAVVAGRACAFPKPAPLRFPPFPFFDALRACDPSICWASDLFRSVPVSLVSPDSTTAAPHLSG